MAGKLGLIIAVFAEYAVCAQTHVTRRGMGRARPMLGVRVKRAGLFASPLLAFLMPDDIANLVLFLASDELRNIDGALIQADGGLRGIVGQRIPDSVRVHGFFWKLRTDVADLLTKRGMI